MSNAPVNPLAAAVRICFRSWFMPGRWMSELATLCNLGLAA